jgi:hypothetical protein
MRDRQGFQATPDDRIFYARDSLDLVASSFVTDITEAIKEATIVIHDITTFKPGVAYEIGLSLGLKKPFLLIVDEARNRDVKAEDFPDIIAKELHINFEKIDRHSLAPQTLSRLIRGRLDVSPGRLSWDHRPIRNRVSVYIDPSYSQLRGEVNQLVRRQTKQLQMPNPQQLTLPQLGSLFATSSAAIVNYDSRAPESAVALGLAAGLGVPAVALYDVSRVSRLSMWSGTPVPWTDETLSQDLEALERWLRETLRGPR